MPTLCVYCGSSDRVPAHYLELATSFGAAMAARGIDLVYGAGRTGLMGRVADAVLRGGGRAVGVIPDHLNTPELVHDRLSQRIEVRTMHERKARMAHEADAFVALPGGIGTLDELAEIITWAQLGLHAKPVGLLDLDGYWSGLLSWLDRGVADGFLAASHRRLLTVATEPQDLLDRMLGTTDANPVEPRT